MKFAYLAAVGLLLAACGTDGGVRVESPRATGAPASTDAAPTAEHQAAHAAYLAGECAAAVQRFDALLADDQWLAQAGSLVTEVTSARDECNELLTADTLVGTDPPSALVAYARLLALWPDTALRDLVDDRAGDLALAPGPAALAGLTSSCPMLDEIALAGLVSDVTEVAIRAECAGLYSAAGQSGEAFTAAMRVLRATTDPLLAQKTVPVLLAGTEMCASFDEVRALTGLDQRPAELSFALQSCINHASATGDPEKAAWLQLAFLSALPDDPAAPAVAAGLMQPAEACAVLGDAQADPVVLARPGFVADFTFHCAQVAEYQADFNAAVDRYQWCLDNAVDEDHAALARDGLARSLINRAEGVGAGELPEPVPTGGAGRGISDVVVYNDSPEELRLVLSGPESRIEIIPASPTSSTYSVVGPPMCRTDVPSIELKLAPGDYRALVEATSGNVSPFSGDWTLTSGDAFQSCFFIVQTYI